MAYDQNGNLLPLPQRADTQDTAIQAITVAVQAAKDDVHTTTGIPPVALGALDPTNRSGAAIKALQGQAEVGSSIYLDNLRDISLPYEGKVVRDLIARIYDRPGRQVAAIAEDGTRRSVLLNVPYQDTPQGAVPLPGWKEGMPVPQGAKYINLSQGQYVVQPVVGRSFQTRRREAADAIATMMGNIPPEMAAAIAPAMIETQDWPEARRVAAIAKQALPPQLQQAYNDNQPSEQQLQAENAQLKQQLQQAGMMVQDLQQKAQTKMLDAQTKIQTTQMDNQTQLEIARLRTAGTMAVGQAKVDAENFRSFTDALETKIAHDEGFRLHLAKTLLAHLVNTAQTSKQHAHEVGMAAMEATHSALAADQASQNPDTGSQDIDTSQGVA
jgi:hypothetical protein